MRDIEAELERIRDEACRLAEYDLTLEGGRARTKFLALIERENALRARIRPEGAE